MGQLLPNPEPRWVTTLLEKREQIESAIGYPIGRVFGCGSFGCTYDTTDPWSVKLTIDPDEAPVWSLLQRIQQSTPERGAGATIVKDIVRLHPDARWKGRRMAVHAVVREKVIPVFTGDKGELTDYSRAQLQIPDSLPSETVFDDRLTHECPDPAKVLAFRAVLNGLVSLRAAAGLHHRMLAARGKQRERYREGRDEEYAQALELLVTPLSMSLALTIDTLMSKYDLLLADVHWGNIGWRFFEEMGPPEIVLFDPGLSHYEGVVELREAWLRRNPEPDIEELRYAVHCEVLECRDMFQATDRAVERLVNNPGHYAEP